VNAGHCGASVSELHNGLEMLLSLSKVMLPTSYDRQTEYYCCIQPCSTITIRLYCISLFALFTTCNILNLLALYITYNFTCVPVWPRSGCMRNAPAVLWMQCLRASILHIQIIYSVQFLLDDIIAQYL